MAAGEKEAAAAQVALKFCPETNDLLYPRENKETRRLEFFCKNCHYYVEAEPADQCVWSSESTFSEKDKTIQLLDVISDPTLPRTRDVRCPNCNHTEAVFVSESTESGMTLYFECTNCRYKWRDYV